MRPHSFRRVILPAAVLAALIIFVMQLSGTVFEDYLRVDTTGGTTGTGAGAVVFITTDVTAIGNGAGDVLPVTEEDHTHNHPPPQERKQQQQQDLQQPQQQEQLQLVPNKSTSTGQTLVKRKDEDMFLDEPFNPRESLQQQEEEEEEVKEGVDERIVRLAENDNDGVDIEGVEQLNDEKPDLQAQLAQLQEQQERLNSVGITSAWESVSKTSSIGGNPVSLPDNRYTRRAQAVRKSSQPTQPPHETSWWYQFKYNPGWAPQSTPKKPLPAEVRIVHAVVNEPLPDLSSCVPHRDTDLEIFANLTSAAKANLTIKSIEPVGSSAVCPLVNNVVFFKTHKTASTTMSSIFFRFGVKHQLRFLVSATHYIEFTTRVRTYPANISMYHHRTRPLGYNFTEITSWYRTKVPNPQFVTIVREPLKRAMSEWLYLLQPDYGNDTLGMVLGANYSRPANWYTLATDLGIYTDSEMDFFLTEGHKQFALIAVVEQFDESLVLMKRLFGWSFDDILYLPLLDSCVERWRSWDHQQVQCSAKVEHPPETVEALKKLVQHDYLIYDLAVKELKRKINEQPPDFWDEVKLFKAMQQQLSNECPRGELPMSATDLPKKPTKRLKTADGQYIGSVLWGAAAAGGVKTSADVPAGSTSEELERPPTPTPPVSARCGRYRLNDLQFERIIKYSRGQPSIASVEAEGDRLYGNNREIDEDESTAQASAHAEHAHA